jgi:hypothetical protein
MYHDFSIVTTGSDANSRELRTASALPDKIIPHSYAPGTENLKHPRG